jgi:hypothetical protein
MLFGTVARAEVSIGNLADSQSLFDVEAAL